MTTGPIQSSLKSMRVLLWSLTQMHLPNDTIFNPSSDRVVFT